MDADEATDRSILWRVHEVCHVHVRVHVHDVDWLLKCADGEALCMHCPRIP